MCVDPVDWFSEECYTSGLDEAPSGDYPFTHPSLYFIEILLHVADEWYRFTRLVYNVLVIGVDI